MLKKVFRNDEHIRRRVRVRIKISGTPECLHLNVFRLSNSIHAQAIDDVNGVTLAFAGSVELRLGNSENVKAAKTIGTEIARRVIEKNITDVVFGRGGYVYTGRVGASAEAARVVGSKL